MLQHGKQLLQQIHRLAILNSTQWPQNWPIRPSGLTGEPAREQAYQMWKAQDTVMESVPSVKDLSGCTPVQRSSHQKQPLYMTHIRGHQNIPNLKLWLIS